MTALRAIPRPVHFLLRQRWLVLLLLSPFLLFPSPSTAWTLLVVPVWALLAWFAGEPLWMPNPFNPALLVLSIMVLVSLGATNNLAHSLPKLAGVVLGLGVFDCFTRYGVSPRGWLMCLGVFLLTGLGIAVVGLLGTHWSLKFDWLASLTYRFEPRITGLPGAEQGISPNELAGALLWVIPTFCAVSWVSLTQPKRSASASRRWLAPAQVLVCEATVLIVLVFLLCQSRGAYLGLVVALILAGLWQLRHRWLWLASALFAIGVIGATLVWRDTNDQLFHEQVSALVAPDAVTSKSLSGRDKVWARALVGIAQYPLTGMGMNTFRYRFNELAPLETPMYVDRDIAHAHNEFLQAALDLGLPGLGAFIGLYVIAFRQLHKTARRAAETRAPTFFLGDPRIVQALVLGLGIGLGAHLMYGLTDAVTLGAKPGVLFWMLLGLIAGLAHHTRPHTPD